MRPMVIAARQRSALAARIVIRTGAALTATLSLSLQL